MNEDPVTAAGRHARQLQIAVRTLPNESVSEEEDVGGAEVFALAISCSHPHFTKWRYSRSPCRAGPRPILD